MTTLFDVEAVQQFGRLATRTAGASARELILNALKTHEAVRIDMTDMNLTPSFADECFGALKEDLGLEEFKRRVHLTNLSESASQLLSHVLSRRERKKLPSQ